MWSGGGELSKCPPRFHIEMNILGNHFSSRNSVRHAEQPLDHLLPPGIMPTETLDYRQVSQMRSQVMSPIIRRIQSEYAEMPGLKLTEAQARRLWALDGDTCRLVLVTLIERRFLKRTASGMYGTGLVMVYVARRPTDCRTLPIHFAA